MELRNIEYVHEPLLAPIEDILKAYKKKEINRETYEGRHIELLNEHKVKDKIDEIIDNKTSIVSTLYHMHMINIKHLERL
ncbi:hypothetical protein ACFSO7_21875 [Bacillus sp. CGMCC 1.16607]|uniref:hypothetical protein n=1 Tax=Bacillus sp. CGMCC 1.16607 TaxID=3351842 RepID=UPI00363584C7